MFGLTNKIIAVALCLCYMAELGNAKAAITSEVHKSYCGGVIYVPLDSPATINYKLNEEYENNEQCVWTVRVDGDSSSLRFVKTESNFEMRYDFLQISAFNEDNLVAPIQTATFGNVNGQEEVIIEAPIVFVIFSTDESNNGTGFSLDIEAIPGSGYDYMKTDFFVDTPVGNTSLRPYFSHMLSTYVITPNNVESLELEVIIDIRLHWDFVSVMHCQRNGGRIFFLPYGAITGTENRTYTADAYTTFVVIFSSGSLRPLEGFDLSWTSGTQSGSTQGYRLD